MEIRPFEPGDADAVRRIVLETWPDDPELGALHASAYAPDLDEDGRFRRTVVAVVDGAVVGAGALFGGRSHPTRIQLDLDVAKAFRRRGVAGALYDRLTELGDGRPFMVRVRESEGDSLAFLGGRGFRKLARIRMATVDPTAPETAAWRAEARTDEAGYELRRPGETKYDASVADIARAHERVYRQAHDSWFPMSEWPLERSTALFCGEGWVRESNVLAYREGGLVGVASLHGPPMARAGELYLVFLGAFGVDRRAAGEISRALAAHCVDFARVVGTSLRIEVDDGGDGPVWQVLTAIPATHGPDTLMLANDP